MQKQAMEHANKDDVDNIDNKSLSKHHKQNFWE